MPSAVLEAGDLELSRSALPDWVGVQGPREHGPPGRKVQGGGEGGECS